MTCLILCSRRLRRDVKYASRLANDLRRAGWEVAFRPQKSRDENAWRKDLADDIDNADFLIVCVSEEGLEDDQLRTEVRVAKEGKHARNFILVMITKCYHAVRQYNETRDFSNQLIDGEEYSSAFPQLLRDIHKIEAQTREEQPPSIDWRAEREQTKPEEAIRVLPAHRPREDWGEAIDAINVNPFYGREELLAKLQRAIVEDEYRLVALLGIGGIGKSALAVKLVEAVKSEFDFLFWRDLRTAPPVERVIGDFLRFLSGQYPFDLPDDTEGQIALMIDLMRKSRCIVILDNFEPILTGDGSSGQYRAGYEGYGKLIFRLGAADYRSCLILTSRQRPQEFAQFTGRDAVCVKEIGPLQDHEARALLRGLELHATDRELDALNARYSGNPFALKHAASSILSKKWEVSTFLRQAPTLFGNIHQLLDEQFKLLSDFERQVMYWLALERAPVSTEVLRNDFVVPPNQRELYEALEALRRRFLVETTAERFLLQSLVMEYATDQLTSLIPSELLADSISLFNTYALIKAEARDYVREAQTLSILKPIADTLLSRLGRIGIVQEFSKILSNLRKAGSPPGYVAGNVINILAHLKMPSKPFDFSKLNVRQAYLVDVPLHGVDFSQAVFSNCIFNETFGNVLSVAFSPDGTLFAASTGTGLNIRLWHAQDARSLLNLRGHTDWVWSVAFSPDSTMLASGGYDQTVRLWDVNSGECLKTLLGHIGGVRSVSFRPDGRLLASCGDDGTIHFWDVESGECVKVLSGESKERISSVAFSRGGKWLVSAGNDKTVRVWDTFSGDCVLVLRGHKGPVWSVAFSPNAKRVASCGDDYINGENDYTVRLWNVESGECERVLRRHTNSVTSVDFSPDGLVLVSGGKDNAINLWNINNGECLRTLYGHAQWIWSVRFSPKGHKLVSGSEDHTVRLWDANTGEGLKTLHGYSNKIYAVALAPGGDMLASGHEDHAVRLWDPTNGQIINTFRGPDCHMWSVAFSPDGSMLVGGGYDPNVWVWHIKTGRLRILRGHTRPMNSVAFSPDGRTVASSNEDKTIRLWNAHTGELRKTLECETGWLWPLAFNSDGTLLASSYEQAVRVWEVSTGEPVLSLEGHQDVVWGVVFSPDGETIASCSEDGTVKLWDVNTGECVNTLVEHIGRVWSAAFILRGKQLVSGGIDERIRVWDVETGECLDVLSGHDGQISCIASNPQGGVFVSGSLDETVRIWDSQTRECLKALHVDRIYERMNFTGATGINETQRNTLRDLGAIEEQQ